MYHNHFSLKQEPFGVSPDGRFFYQTEQHREALAGLYYAIEQRRGFAVLVSRPGLGKTSILVQLLQLLEGKAEIAYLPQTFFDRSTVLDSILSSLNVAAGSSPAQSHRIFYEYLIKLRLAGKTCVAVFDEAHGLDHETLEAIRMLSNFETPTEKLLQIVLAGQPQLADTLGRPECEQLKQRVNFIARLEPVSTAEIRDYIAHRLTTAGGSATIFTPEATEAVALASGGVFRNVNTICFNALTIAYGLDRQCVGAAEVGEALDDLVLPVNTIPALVSSPPIESPDIQLNKAKPDDPSLAKIAIPSWSLRIRVPIRTYRNAIIAAALGLVTVGTLFARSLLLASR
jgi:type II secretory pathway predicted ATPase ExeA